MLVHSLIALAIALLGIYIRSNATDEIVQLAATLTTGFCLLLSLIFAPWLIKLLLLMAILVSQKRTNNVIQGTF